MLVGLSTKVREINFEDWVICIHYDCAASWFKRQTQFVKWEVTWFVWLIGWFIYGFIYWTLTKSYLLSYDPPGDFWRVPTGTRSGIVRTPAGLRPGPLQAESGPHRLLPKYRRGSGKVPCELSFKICPRVPSGSRQGPRRAPAGQFTGLIRGLFIAGARVTFKLELKRTWGPRGVKKMDDTRSGFHRVPCGTAKKRPKKPGNCPGRPLWWIVTKA